MINQLLLPFEYDYMLKALWTSTLVGGLCAFLSVFLILKAWSLMGDALSHSVVPGVAISYSLHLPLVIGAFFAGLLAALSMLLLRKITLLRADAVIGLVFSSFFAFGLLLISLNPSAINITTIIFGNILGISDQDALQITVIALIGFALLTLFWKTLCLIFFDEIHAHTLGIHCGVIKVLFFSLLSISIVAALQTVGAILVTAMLITPGATAYLLTDRFDHLICFSVLIGLLTGCFGAYLSFFFDAPTGSFIVVLQTLAFLIAFIFAPKYGRLVQRKAYKNQIHKTKKIGKVTKC